MSASKRCLQELRPRTGAQSGASTLRHDFHRRSLQEKTARNHDAAKHDSASVPPIVSEVLASPGQPLDGDTRGFFEPRFGHDFSDVRVHTSPTAAASARAVNSLAYTVGRNVVIGAHPHTSETTEGRGLLAHELTHVAQQKGSSAESELTLGARGSSAEQEAHRVSEKIVGLSDDVGALGIQHSVSPATVQRYEGGEHAQFGETGDIIKAEVEARAFTYKVKSGETLEKIAKKFGIEVDDLKAANSAKLKKWRTTKSGGKKGSGWNVVEGFNAGEVIIIPPVINEFTKAALKTKELIFTVNGVDMEYGVGISMGDFYASAADMLKAPASELQALAALVKKEKGGTPVTTKEWDDATGDRYHKLAEKNESHFAPSNPKLVATSSAPHGSDHKTEWEKNHKDGLDQSQAGKKDEALRINAFADHFLTDAFAAGHMINKRDVMEKFKGNLTTDPKGKFIGDAKTFFDNVATTAWGGSIQTEFSKYKTVASYNMNGDEDPTGYFHPSINDAGRFSGLLQGIQKKEPDVLSNAVAKAVHDDLNTTPKGIPVENAKADKWDLSGDGTLNTKSKEIGRKAVAQSQLNVLDSFKVTGTIDYPVKYKKVWDYVPYPTSAGETQIKSKVASGTDPKSTGLVAAIVALVKTNYLVIIKELVTRKILSKA